MLNINSLYSHNVITNYGAAAVHGERWCDITNIETTFEENTGPGARGIVTLYDRGSLINNGSIFR